MRAGSAHEPLLLESQRPYAHEAAGRASWCKIKTRYSAKLARSKFNENQLIAAATSSSVAAPNSLNRTRKLNASASSSNASCNLLKSKSNALEATARASQIIETFGKFISMRNNCDDDSAHDNSIGARYLRQVNHCAQFNANSNNNRPHHIEFDSDVLIRGNNSLASKARLQSSEINSGYSLRCCKRVERSKTRHLLNALFNDKHRNKSSLLISLLRTPVVLAALFSLILVISLIVLYALSFQQHNRPHELLSHRLHHINGRDLDFLFSSDSLPLSSSSNNNNKSQETGGSRSDDADDDDDSATGREAHLDPVNDDGLARALTVQTECASFRGAPDGSGIVFKGIPFASPPIGPRRWRRPRPVWLDAQLCRPGQVTEARSWRSHCAQVSPVTRRFSGHEDCLYLDIYTPRLDQDKKLPVMVYIHGGFLAFGSSGQGGVNWLKGRPSAQLASELQVVMVAFNYRLQALGFMTMLQFGAAQDLNQTNNNNNNANNAPEGSGEGNYGLWDQLVALNWIKRNIESFGGNPSNIVLFGPDSASSIALALLEGSDPVEAGAINRNSPQIADPNGRLVSRPASAMLLSQGEQALAANAAANQTIDRDLFRAVWLTNPAIYYQLGYQAASLHYQRLFLGQSPCRPTEVLNIRRQPADEAAVAMSNSGRSADHQTRKPLDSEALPANASNPAIWSSKTDDGAQSYDRAKTKPPRNDTAAQSFDLKPMGALEKQRAAVVRCLMNLSAEQVVRHYLAKDDPSYRLDDENSFPVHGIFADQFVTIDGELVLRASYPPRLSAFKAKSSSSRSSESFLELESSGASKPPNAKASSAESNVLLNHNQPGGSEISAEQEATAPVAATHYDYSKLATKPAGAVTSTTANYDDNCLGSLDCEQRYRNGETRWRGPISKDLLIGSSAQAVEFWSSPRDLDQWNWLDFKRYVATSLNSFSSETFARACQLYGLPSMDKLEEAEDQTRTNSSSAQIRSSNDPPSIGGGGAALAKPKETYLTMVSDIRQICPINELVLGLRDEGHRVHRYIVESRPSKQFNNEHSKTPRPFGNSSPEQANPETKHLVEEAESERGRGQQQRGFDYAYHSWDLFAFFGFHFDPKFKASNEDLQFQKRIRKMVSNFVHSPRDSPTDDFDDDYNTKSGHSDKIQQGELGYTLFVKDGSIRRQTGDAHKEAQCAMWRRHLGASYAWIS